MSLVLAANKPDRFQAMAVKLPGPNADDRMAALEDLGMLTGATPLLKVRGDTLASVTSAHFGRARRVWADPNTFIIIGGRGDPHALRQHIVRLEKNYSMSRDPEARKRLEARIGKLMGGSATLWIGGSTGPEIEVRKALAERTARALRSAVREGCCRGVVLH